MRRTWWLTAAYLATLGLGATLALQIGGAAMPAVAPVGGVTVPEPPAPAPAWEFVHLPAGAAHPLLSVVTIALGGYAADLLSAVASVFPGLR